MSTGSRSWYNADGEVWCELLYVAADAEVIGRFSLLKSAHGFEKSGQVSPLLASALVLLWSYNTIEQTSSYLFEETVTLLVKKIRRN